MKPGEREHFGLVRPETARTIGTVLALVFAFAAVGAALVCRAALLRWVVSL